MTNLFYLDWDIHRLCGWEREKSDIAVASIIKGIECGDVFPPVSVISVGVNSFCIAPMKITPQNGQTFIEANGGHHRAVAHYIAGVSLPCDLYVPRIKSYICMVEIKDICLMTDTKEGFDEKRRYFPAYREL